MILLYLLVVMISPIFGQEQETPGGIPIPTLPPDCDQPIGMWNPNIIKTSQIIVPDYTKGIDHLRLREDTELFEWRMMYSQQSIQVHLEEKYNITGIVYRGSAIKIISFYIRYYTDSHKALKYQENNVGVVYNGSTNLENVTSVFSPSIETSEIHLVFFISGVKALKHRFQFELLGCKEYKPTTISTTTEPTTISTTTETSTNLTTENPCLENLNKTTEFMQLQGEGIVLAFINITFSKPGLYRITIINMTLETAYWVEELWVRVYKGKSFREIKEYRKEDHTVIVNIEEDDVTHMWFSIDTSLCTQDDCLLEGTIDILGCEENISTTVTTSTITESEAEVEFPIEEKRFLSFRRHDHQPHKKNDN